MFKVGQFVIFDNPSDDDDPTGYTQEGYLLGDKYEILSISNGHTDAYRVVLEPSDPKFDRLRFKFDMLRPASAIRRF